MLKSSMAVLAAASLLGTSGIAAAQTAAPLSISTSPAAARIGASADGASDFEGRGTGTYIIVAVVLGLIVWGISELIDDGDRAFPASP